MNGIFIAILIAVLFAGALGKDGHSEVRHRFGVRFESGHHPDFDYEIKIEDEKTKIEFEG